MASHRPADNPPLPEPVAPPAAATPGGKVTVQPSGFLAGFDWLLAAGVVVLAFFLASFAARNTDLWMHLASGRLLANGQYQFGKDPFSYVGADRVWVNHAWLFDWVAYQLYKAGEGQALIVGKAVLVALMAGFLLLARKPGQSVFPGVICVGLGLLAAAPRFLLQPALMSFFCLAALMFLIIRVPRRPGSWTFPILVAALFWVWSNTDQWFIVGPAVLALYTSGQYLRPDEGEDPGILWRGLGLGIVACMLNPHHVRVWALPSEAFDARLAETFKGDVELGAIFTSGLSKEVWRFEIAPANVTALILLLVLTFVGFIVNRRQASAGLGLVVVGTAALAALHLRAMPFFALAAAPVAALNLASLGRRLADTPMAEGTARAVETARGTGRSLVALAGLLLIALTYPGWAHPLNEQRRWKWDVEPSQSLVRAAERIQKWRTDGDLPPEARLLNLSPDLAHVVAWHAPSEKSFFDTRLKFHRPEAGEYAALRKYLVPRDPRERRQDPYDLAGFLHKHRITYAVSAHRFRSHNLAAVNALWGDEPSPGTGPEWALWHMDGRAVILGWTQQDAIPQSAFDRLKFDPLRAAYAEAEPLPAPDVRPPLPPRDVWERFVVAPPIVPPESEEAFILMRYRESLMGRAAFRHRLTLETLHYIARDRLMNPAVTLWTFLPLIEHPRLQSLVPPAMPPEVSAVAILAVRAARRAIATSPDHPDGYYYLAKAYADSAYYSDPDIQELVVTASLGRVRARLPDDPTARRPTIDVLDLCYQLEQLHRRGHRLDLLFDLTKLGIVYLTDDIKYLEDELSQAVGEVRERLQRDLDARQKELTNREKAVKEAEKELASISDKYVNESAGLASALDRAAAARRYGLTQQAVAELYKAHEQFQKQLGDGTKKFSSEELAQQLAGHAELIELMLYVGRVEEAAQILNALDTPDTVALMGTDAVRAAYFNARQQYLAVLFRGRRPRPTPHDMDPAGHYRTLRHWVSLCVGDFDRAAEAQNQELPIRRREFAAFRDQHFPNGLPKTTGLLDPFDPRLDLQARGELISLGMFSRAFLSPLNPGPALVGGFGQALAWSMHLENVNRLLALESSPVNVHMRLALTYLEQGNIPDAVKHFGQALISPDFPQPMPAQRQAKEYLRAINQATGGRGN
jgi:hypothetical protein